MKKLLIILLLFTAFTSSAQVYQRDPAYGRSIDRYEVLKDLGIPTFCGTPEVNSTVTNKAKIAYDSCGHLLYKYDPSTGVWSAASGSDLSNYYSKTQIDSIFSLISAINNGLISTGGITLVDSTVTINDTIKWSYNGIAYTKITPSSFIINSADSGYYRRDLIYADTSGLLYKLAGVEGTSIALVPNLPDNSIVVTIVDVYGNQIAPPFADSIGIIPNLQQVTNQGNSTTNPIFINANSTQAPLRITSDFNRSNYLYFKNRSNGNWANTGFLFKNDVADDAGNEWTGHWFRLMMGSTNSDMAKDAGILMTNGTGGLKIVSDSGRIAFNSGSPAYPYDTNSHAYKEMGAFETDGSFRLNNYKNNVSGDSVLSTDEDGKVILKKVAVGDIDVLQNTTDSSSFGIKKLDGTVKPVKFIKAGDPTGGGDTIYVTFPVFSGGVDVSGKVNYTDSTIKYVTPTQLASLHNTLNLYKPLYGNSSDTSIHIYTETDTTLADNSDTTLPTTKAVKAYVDNHAGGGGITPNQTTIATTDGQTVFAFSNLPSSTDSYDVYVNGCMWADGWTASGNNITLTATDISDGDKITLVFK